MHWFVAALTMSALLLLGTVPTAAGPPDQSTLEAELAAVETAFAKTMADRDHAAFVSFLHRDTIFVGQRGPLRGAAAVAAAWKPYFESEAAPFSWQPETVVVRPGGDLGLSSGPVHDPEGKLIGSFNSVWQRQEDGSWKIIFDKGCPAASSSG